MTLSLRQTTSAAALGLGASLLLASPALAGDLTFTDPAGDDFGPGDYTYPTDAAYKRGSFDLREVEVIDKGSKVEFRVTLGAAIADPWDSKSWDGNGFSLQMVQIYIDHTPARGHTDGLPGINAGFAEADAWDKVVMVSPQGTSRLKSEIGQKAGRMAGDVVIPTKTTVKGKRLIAVVKKSDLGGSPDASWGVQAVMQSNEGYPDGKEILARKVNEYAGQHRFGGGSDWDCDPHVLDILVAPAKGGDAEKDGQKKAMAYKCGPDGKSVSPAVLPMVRGAGG